MDVRILAATNRDPGSGPRDSRFREDLYYPPQVVTITLPPCASAGNILLVDYFLDRCREMDVANQA